MCVSVAGEDMEGKERDETIVKGWCMLGESYHKDIEGRMRGETVVKG